MKKIYIVYVLLLAFAVSCKPKQDDTKQKTGDSAASAQDSVANEILTDSAQLQIASPYTIVLTDTKAKFPPALQSFGMAVQGNQWLMVGGRTNGFHGTSDNESTFPTKFSNNKMYVVDVTAQKSYSLPIPDAFKLQLQSTNMNCTQDGDYLYCVGGYGSTCADDKPGCYQTFPNLTAINVPNAIQAIIDGNSANLTTAITTLQDERMRVTGGALRKIGDWFYLVMGQNFDTIYQGGLTGNYTQQVRKFKIGNSGGQLSINNYFAYDVPWTTAPLNEQFHRRDLTVSETILEGGMPGLTVYGGVFTPTGGSGFQNPIYIHQGTSGLTYFSYDRAFKQKLNLYECSNVTLYDPTTSLMYTSLMGGITYYYYDKAGNLIESNQMNFLPFSKNVTTIVRSTTQRVAIEFPQKSPALPGFIGANAEFIPSPVVTMYNGSHTIIDYSKLAPQSRTLVGWVYGGITATAEQSSEFNPTFASNKIYEVWLVKN